jgi:hypothetical protein
VDRARTLRLTGAALVLLGGFLHLQLQLDEHGTEAIGRAFALNAVASGLVAAYLVLRHDVVGPILGMALSAGSLVAFALSRVGDGLLDFRETGFDGPHATLTVVTELLALVVLAGAAVATRRATSSLRS